MTCRTNKLDVVLVFASCLEVMTGEYEILARTLTEGAMVHGGCVIGERVECERHHRSKAGR